MRILRFFGIRAEIGRVGSFILRLLPFAVLIIGYVYLSEVRHKENPNDKLTPTISQIGDGFWRTAFVKDLDGEYRLWVDTFASGKRFLAGIGILFFGIILGLNMGLLPFLEKLFLNFFLLLDNVPPMALLAILFIIFGTEEESKIVLIVFGTFPKLVLDVYWSVKKDIPEEQIIKGYTLGAKDYQITYRIALPQIYPKALISMMLSIGTAISFIIAAEAITAQSGLGYRIFVVKRFMAMDIIIAYVIWMALLAFVIKLLMNFWAKYPKQGNRIVFFMLIIAFGIYFLMKGGLI